MYEGHCTRLLLDVVIRLGDVQSRWTITETKPSWRLLWLQRSSHTSSSFSVWRISASYMADIITTVSYYSGHPRTLKMNEMASLILLITLTEWVIFCCCDCESKPLPVFLQSFGLLACLRVLIHQVKPWSDALVPSVMIWSWVSCHFICNTGSRSFQGLLHLGTTFLIPNLS